MADGDGSAPQTPDVSSLPATTQTQGNAPPLPQKSSGSPPKIGKPILLSLIQNMIKPQSPGVDPSTGVMRPPSRLDAFEGFLGNFVNALGQGFANAGHGPGSFGRGFGAAATAPYRQGVQEYGMQQQQQAQEAQIGREQAQTQLTQAQARPINIPGIGTLPAGSVPPIYRGVPAAEINKQSKEETTQETNKTRENVARINQGAMADVPQEIQDEFGVPGKLPAKTLRTLMGAAVTGQTTIQGANDQINFNRITGKETPLGVGNPRVAATLARPIQVGDPNNPGNTVYTSAGQAIRSGAPGPSSASVTVPKAVQKDFTSGQSAKTLNAFNTATEHLQTLSQLGNALQNGSTPLINKFANAYATSTGAAAPTNFNLAKAAVAGEVAKTFKGNATEGEIAQINQVINAAQSPAQLKGAISTALNLMGSKKQALLGQYQQGLRGKPAFEHEGANAPQAVTNAKDPLGIR